MDFLDLVSKRYSVRDYLETPVEEAKLQKVLEAGRLAPSACNNQPWVFIILRDAESLNKLHAVYNRPWFLRAPMVIAACCDRRKSWRRNDGKDYGDVDIAIALDHMILSAAELGLGTCWIANFNPVEARKILLLPDLIDPIAFTPLGYPGTKAATPKVRKNTEEIVHWEYYGGKKQ